MDVTSTCGPVPHADLIDFTMTEWKPPSALPSSFLHGEYYYILYFLFIIHLLATFPAPVSSCSSDIVYPFAHFFSQTDLLVPYPPKPLLATSQVSNPWETSLFR